MEWLRWIDVPIFLVFAAVVSDHRKWDARHVIGIAIAAIGFALWMLARIQLGKSFSVRAQAKGLVTTGLYSRFRNPIYLFGGVAFLGVYIVWGEVLPLLAFLLLYSLSQAWRARKEAAVLENAFGDEYRRYKASTWL